MCSTNPEGVGYFSSSSIAVIDSIIQNHICPDVGAVLSVSSGWDIEGSSFFDNYVLEGNAGVFQLIGSTLKIFFNVYASTFIGNSVTKILQN
jgi:hypothetical protein